ncbi:hypothetical protein EG68_06687 [Paragonimus skrjabini miyazakii]|uniref:Uncharacterized protein n=1 Tax=Paragonimus skrjabini miyazakii TaxID=59628 RepID=A0A8S9YC64_9TREM|nr:hypothetical protein EG68_06687 [Paragonimus skrjabini miyazakii]
MPDILSSTNLPVVGFLTASQNILTDTSSKSETLNKPPLRTIMTEIHVPKLQVRRSETLRRQTIHMDSEDKWIKI